MDDTFNKLLEYFTKFPGIGPRQAKRFVYFLLAQDTSSLKNFSEYIKELKESVIQCKECKRYFDKGTDSKQSVCSICASAKKNNSLLIVEKDQDLESIHKSDVYDGKYFVLGGVLPILEKTPEKKIRLIALKTYIKQSNFNEIIIALSVNPEGNYTADYLKKLFDKEADIKVTLFGKGLSTGTELEYSDKDTIKNALKNRR